MQYVSLPSASVVPITSAFWAPIHLSRAYIRWIHAAANSRTYFAAIGQVLIRDLLLPYCYGAGEVPATRCSESLALYKAARHFPRYRVHDFTAKYAILHSDTAHHALCDVLLIDYAGAPRYITMRPGRYARVVTHNIVEIYTSGYQPVLLYIGDNLVLIDLENTEVSFKPWGAHGVRVADLYYDFRELYAFRV